MGYVLALRLSGDRSVAVLVDLGGAETSAAILEIRRCGIDPWWPSWNLAAGAFLLEGTCAAPNAPRREALLDVAPVSLHGLPDGLTAAVFRQRPSGATYTCPLRHLFLFIGADPNAGWLQDRVAVDSKGFVVTGFACPNDARPSSVSM